MSAATYGATLDESQEAVVDKKFVCMPDGRNASNLVLEAGTSVVVLGSDNGWAYVKTSFGRTGAIPMSHLKPKEQGPASGQRAPGSSSAQALLLRGSRPPPAGAFFRDEPAAPAMEDRKRTKAEQFAPFACEFVGTFALTFVIACCSICGSSVWTPTAVGGTLMVLTYALGPVSGGNLNPAVSLMLGLLGRLRWPVLLGYLLSQFAAALLAGCAVFALFSEAVEVGPVSPYGLVFAGLCEMGFTAVLCLVFANCAPGVRSAGLSDDKQFYALAIGFVIIAGGHSCGAISGAMFNPAVAVGLDVAYLSDGFWNGLIYALFEAVGAIVAAILFKIIRLDDSGDATASPHAPHWTARCISEFLGTFVLVITFGLCVVTTSEETAWAAGAAATCMIYSLGDVAGGYFNPAATFAVFLSGRMQCRAKWAIIYTVIQLSAGLLAGLVLTFVHEAGPYKHEVFGIAPKADYTWLQVFVMEVFFTFLLAWVVLSVATVSHAYPGNTGLSLPPKTNFYFALAIGSCLTIAGFAAGAVSGGVVNPAISLGLSVEMVEVNSSSNATSAPGFLVDRLISHSRESLHGGNLTHRITSSSNATSTLEPFARQGRHHFSGSIGDQNAPQFMNFVWFSLYELVGSAVAATIFHATHSHEYHAKNAPSLPS